MRTSESSFYRVWLQDSLAPGSKGPESPPHPNAVGARNAGLLDPEELLVRAIPYDKPLNPKPPHMTKLRELLAGSGSE